jgi:hypothetical protein
MRVLELFPASITSTRNCHTKNSPDNFEYHFYMYICMYVYMYVCMYVCMYIYMYICIYVYIF